MIESDRDRQLMGREIGSKTGRYSRKIKRKTGR